MIAPVSHLMWWPEHSAQWLLNPLGQPRGAKLCLLLPVHSMAITLSILVIMLPSGVQLFDF